MCAQLQSDFRWSMIVDLPMRPSVHQRTPWCRNLNEGLDLRGVADDKPGLWRAMPAIDV